MNPLIIIASISTHTQLVDLGRFIDDFLLVKDKSWATTSRVAVLVEQAAGSK